MNDNKSNSADPSPADARNIIALLENAAKEAEHRGFNLAINGLHEVSREVFDAIPAVKPYATNTFMSGGERWWSKRVGRQVALYTNEPPVESEADEAGESDVEVKA